MRTVLPVTAEDTRYKIGENGGKRKINPRGNHENTCQPQRKYILRNHDQLNLIKPLGFPHPLICTEHVHGGVLFSNF